MASIGDLVANLTVNSSGWSRGLKTAKSETGGFVSSVGAMLSSPVGKLAALAAGAVSVGAAFYGVTQSIGRTAGVADQAARTGLSGGFLQQLAFAADQAGVSNETLTKSLSKMTLQVGEATSGNATAAASFQRLGVSVDNLKSMQPQEQFAAISDALGGISDPAQRAAAAVDIFGKSGAELGPLFAEGVGGLNAALEQASMLGIGLSDEDIVKAAAADDAMSRLSSTVSGVIDKVSAKLAPVWTAFADTATATIVTISGVTEGLGGTVDWLGGMAATVFDSIAKASVTAFSVAEFAVKNWQQVGEYAFTAVELTAVSLFGEVTHFFSTAIPGYLTWFADNWRDVFFTAFDFVTTGFINLGENIQNAWSAILDYITGNSDELALVWKPLSEGFANTIKEMPNIPDRVKGELEVSLGKQLDNIGQNLGNSLSGTIEKNLTKLPSIKNAIAATAPSVTASETTDAELKQAAKGGKDIGGFLAAGSVEAYSAVVAAMNGGGNKVQAEQLAELKKINSGITKQTSAMNFKPQVVESLA